MNQTQTQAQVIKEIHELFDTAPDRLVKQAQQIIDKASKAEGLKTKAQRLERLGFATSKPVRDCNDSTNEIMMAKNIISKIEYCRVAYPLYKYITAEEVRMICDKYNLMLGDAYKYSGDIPEKNLCEIEAFRLKRGDAINSNHYVDLGYIHQHPIYDGAISFARRNGWSASMEQYEQQIRQQQQYLHNEVEAESTRRSGIEIFADYLKPSSQKSKPKTVEEPEVEPLFKIVAPMSDFKINADDRIQGHELINDPIVLCPIYDGFLVVSKWGLEASDPSLLNEQHN